LAWRACWSRWASPTYRIAARARRISSNQPQLQPLLLEGLILPGSATARRGKAYLSAVIENYFAPSLRSSGPGSLGIWSEEELAQFLETGANADGIAFGSMSDVITHSTQYLTPADALATAKYLKALRNPDEEFATRFTYEATEHLALKNGDASKPGARIYLDNCAACHRPDGVGYELVFPRLAGNPVVQAGN